MNSIRTKFQQLSSELEQRLADYKNGYPNNYAMMAIKMMPVFVMMLSVMMDGHMYAVYRIDEQMEADTTVLVVLAQLLLVFGLAWFIRGLKKTKKVKSDALKLSITAAQDEYNEYPDVKDYLQKISGDLSATKKQKTKMKIIFNIVFWGFFVIYGTAIYIFTTPWYKLQRTIGVNNYSRILKMPINKDYYASDTEPFLVLIPYKADISDSIKIEDWRNNCWLEYISNIEKINEVKEALNSVPSRLDEAENVFMNKLANLIVNAYETDTLSDRRSRFVSIRKKYNDEFNPKSNSRIELYLRSLPLSD